MMDDAWKNHWFDEKCARAFWDQKEAIPYQQLVRDTARHLDPRPGETWLDLGCGSGQLTALLWQLGEGKLAQITSIDCASINSRAIEKLKQQLLPRPSDEQIRFEQRDLSLGLAGIADASIDGIVSGLALSYAESRDTQTGNYTDQAFRTLFAEIDRVLKPSGRLVFSINVPEPQFGRIVWESLGKTWRFRNLGKLILNIYRMNRYGNWLKGEARKGRFHYLPIEKLSDLLRQSGFGSIQHSLSYAEQAYVIRVRKQKQAHRVA